MGAPISTERSLAAAQVAQTIPFQLLDAGCDADPCPFDARLAGDFGRGGGR